MGVFFGSKTLAGFELDGKQVKKGTRLLAVRVMDDELWRQVKAGELGEFPIGGSELRQSTTSCSGLRPKPQGQVVGQFPKLKHLA